MDQLVCRTCLEEIIDTNYVKLDDEANETKQKLAVCVPEMNLNVVPDECICIYCANLLQTAYDFKQRCLRTEEKIRTHKDLSDLSEIKENLEKDERFDVVHGVGIGMEIVFIRDEDLTEYDDIPSETAETVTNENDSVNWFLNVDDEIQENEQLNDSKVKRLSKTDETKKVATTNAAKKMVNTITMKKLTNTNAMKKTKHTKDVTNPNALKKVTNINMMKKLTNANAIKKVTNTIAIKKVANTNAVKKVTNLIKKDTNTNTTKKLPNTTPVKKKLDTNRNTTPVKKKSDTNRNTTPIKKRSDKNGKVDSNRKSIGQYNKINEIDSNSNTTNMKPKKTIAITKINKVEHKCPSCKYETTIVKYFKKHMKRCKYLNIANGSTKQLITKGMLKCSQCNYYTEKKAALTLHAMQLHSTGKKFKCKKCSFVAENLQSLKQHTASHRAVTKSGKFKYNCQKCPFGTNFIQGYNSHIRSKHRQEVTFKCDQCNFTASEKIHVIKHAMKHHPKTNKKKM